MLYVWNEDGSYENTRQVRFSQERRQQDERDAGRDKGQATQDTEAQEKARSRQKSTIKHAANSTTSGEGGRLK